MEGEAASNVLGLGLVLATLPAMVGLALTRSRGGLLRSTVHSARNALHHNSAHRRIKCVSYVCPVGPQRINLNRSIHAQIEQGTATATAGQGTCVRIVPLPPENAIRGRAPWSPFLNFLKIDMFMFQKILN
jgi:hypothetical protein